MARSYEKHRQRGSAIKAKASKLDPQAPARCSVLGCPEPPQRRAGRGLSNVYCASHIKHDQRHGSAWCPSLSAADLKPYRWAAERWLKVHSADPLVSRVLTALDRLMATAGRAAVRTKGERRPPEDRAKLALARLRVAKVKPEKLLLIALTTGARIEEGYCDNSTEFRHVQLAKQAHRLAPLYEPEYAARIAPGSILTQDLKRYPHSSGQVLRHLGKAIDDKARDIPERAVKDVLATKIERFGPRPPEQTSPPGRKRKPPASKFHRDLEARWRASPLPPRGGRSQG